MLNVVPSHCQRKEVGYRLKGAQLPTDSSDSAHNQLTQLTNP